MLNLNQSFILILLGSFISNFPSNSSLLINDFENHNNKVLSSFLFQENRQTPEGFNTITRYRDEFIAAGSDGRIDWISASGTVIKSEKFTGEKFNSIISDGITVITAGDNGTIYVSSEKGGFRKIDSDSKENINSLALFRGKIIAGSDHGEIISGDLIGSLKSTKLAVKGNIVSVSAGESGCFGVTDEGEIIHSVDGIKWNITDFNKVYSGYYKTCYFTKILVTENRIAVIGKYHDGSPVFMLSTLGNVWSERTLIYNDNQGFKNILVDSPNDIIYDPSGDIFYIVFNKGKVMQLPSCNQCNKVIEISGEDLKGISFNENTLMIIGGNFLINTVSIK
jgi:hypothetical protein